ncbi:biotin-dependent carboxyltransferase family protein [Kitasatospora sp. NBC_01287]|uniref:5-oxoprolinase subunit C family protein n=1 Tax=Kitasatospora sp. NBC_01287 TaxID=2903573 RepID=UPI002255828D|nr:biotin-dependent carboxyltransferase family protein [Kitasatospora sp. NBC_01287]MCX4750722.1 biotin-dependent carboxyltransferase family protein [Kitasatospora sp. NBC_01287]
MRALSVVRPGPLTTVQDLGRSGVAHQGVPRAGALDRPAHVAANRLVGNPPGAATLETTLGGVTVRAVGGPLSVAVTGAPAGVRVDGRPAAWGSAVRLEVGETLDVGPADFGVRSYLAVRGGIAVPLVLGSRSADLLTGLGPAPLRAGDLLPVGDPQPTGYPLALPLGASGAEAGAVEAGAAEAGAAEDEDLGTRARPWGADLVPLPGMPTELVLRLRPGPRADWFLPGSLATLARARYRVAAASNRIALRTEGPGLDRLRHQELASEGMVLGAVQVPPDGQPVVFLADHPTTGGYPVLGVVPEADLAAAAQARPGVTVRFVPAPN